MSVLLHSGENDVLYYPFYSHVVTFILAYFVYELITFRFMLYDDKSPLMTQIYFHHTAGICLALFVLFGGMHMTKLGVISMLCEFSQIWITIRTLKGKNDWKGIGAALNSVMIFLSYTVVRIMLFPLLLYQLIN